MAHGSCRLLNATDEHIWCYSLQDIRSIERETAELLKRRMRGDDAGEEESLEAEGEQKVLRTAVLMWWGMMMEVQ